MANSNINKQTSSSVKSDKQSTKATTMRQRKIKLFKLYKFIDATYRQIRKCIPSLEFTGNSESIIMECINNYKKCFFEIYEKEDALEYFEVCGELAQNISRTLDLFKEATATHTNMDEYYHRICELLSIFIACELRLSVDSDDDLSLIASRIIYIIKRHLTQDDEEATHYNILLTLVYIPRLFNAREIVCKIFEEFFPLKPLMEPTALPDKMYILYIIIYYRWMSMKSQDEDKKCIVNMAEMFMKPMVSLCNNQFYVPYLPTYTAHSTATRTILCNLKTYQDLRTASIIDNAYKNSGAIVNLCDDDDDDIVVLDESPDTLSFAEIFAAVQLECTKTNVASVIKHEMNTIIDSVDLTVSEDGDNMESAIIKEYENWLHHYQVMAKSLRESQTRLERQSENCSENVICLDSDKNSSSGDEGEAETIVPAAKSPLRKSSKLQETANSKPKDCSKEKTSNGDHYQAEDLFDDNYPLTVTPIQCNTDLESLEIEDREDDTRLPRHILPIPLRTYESKKHNTGRSTMRDSFCETPYSDDERATSRHGFKKQIRFDNSPLGPTTAYSKNGVSLSQSSNGSLRCNELPQLKEYEALPPLSFNATAERNKQREHILAAPTLFRNIFDRSDSFANLYASSSHNRFPVGDVFHSNMGRSSHSLLSPTDGYFDAQQKKRKKIQKIMRRSASLSCRSDFDDYMTVLQSTQNHSGCAPFNHQQCALETAFSSDVSNEPGNIPDPDTHSSDYDIINRYQFQDEKLMKNCAVVIEPTPELIQYERKRDAMYNELLQKQRRKMELRAIEKMKEKERRRQEKLEKRVQYLREQKETMAKLEKMNINIPSESADENSKFGVVKECAASETNWLHNENNETNVEERTCEAVPHKNSNIKTNSNFASKSLSAVETEESKNQQLSKSKSSRHIETQTINTEVTWETEKRPIRKRNKRTYEILEHSIALSKPPRIIVRRKSAVQGMLNENSIITTRTRQCAVESNSEKDVSSQKSHVATESKNVAVRAPSCNGIKSKKVLTSINCEDLSEPSDMNTETKSHDAKDPDNIPVRAPSRNEKKSKKVLTSSNSKELSEPSGMNTETKSLDATDSDNIPERAPSRNGKQSKKVITSSNSKELSEPSGMNTETKSLDATDSDNIPVRAPSRNGKQSKKVLTSSNSKELSEPSGMNKETKSLDATDSDNIPVRAPSRNGKQSKKLLTSIYSKKISELTHMSTETKSLDAPDSDNIPVRAPSRNGKQSKKDVASINPKQISELTDINTETSTQTPVGDTPKLQHNPDMDQCAGSEIDTTVIKKKQRNVKSKCRKQKDILKATDTDVPKNNSEEIENPAIVSERNIVASIAESLCSQENIPVNKQLASAEREEILETLEDLLENEGNLPNSSSSRQTPSNVNGVTAKEAQTPPDLEVIENIVINEIQRAMDANQEIGAGNANKSQSQDQLASVSNALNHPPKSSVTPPPLLISRIVSMNPSAVHQSKSIVPESHQSSILVTQNILLSNGSEFHETSNALPSTLLSDVETSMIQADISDISPTCINIVMPTVEEDNANSQNIIVINPTIEQVIGENLSLVTSGDSAAESKTNENTPQCGGGVRVEEIVHLSSNSKREENIEIGSPPYESLRVSSDEDGDKQSTTADEVPLNEKARAVNYEDCTDKQYQEINSPPYEPLRLSSDEDENKTVTEGKGSELAITAECSVKLRRLYLTSNTINIANDEKFQKLKNQSEENDECITPVPSPLLNKEDYIVQTEEDYDWVDRLEMSNSRKMSPACEDYPNVIIESYDDGTELLSSILKLSATSSSSTTGKTKSKPPKTVRFNPLAELIPITTNNKYDNKSVNDRDETPPPEDFYRDHNYGTTRSDYQRPLKFVTPATRKQFDDDLYSHNSTSEDFGNSASSSQDSDDDSDRINIVLASSQGQEDLKRKNIQLQRVLLLPPDDLAPSLKNPATNHDSGIENYSGNSDQPLPTKAVTLVDDVNQVNNADATTAMPIYISSNQLHCNNEGQPVLVSTTYLTNFSPSLSVNPFVQLSMMSPSEHEVTSTQETDSDFSTTMMVCMDSAKTGNSILLQNNQVDTTNHSPEISVMTASSQASKVFDIDSGMVDVNGLMISHRCGLSPSTTTDNEEAVLEANSKSNAKDMKKIQHNTPKLKHRNPFIPRSNGAASKSEDNQRYKSDEKSLPLNKKENAVVLRDMEEAAKEPERVNEIEKVVTNQENFTMVSKNVQECLNASTNAKKVKLKRPKPYTAPISPLSAAKPADIEAKTVSNNSNDSISNELSPTNRKYVHILPKPATWQNPMSESNTQQQIKPVVESTPPPNKGKRHLNVTDFQEFSPTPAKRGRKPKANNSQENKRIKTNTYENIEQDIQTMANEIFSEDEENSDDAPVHKEEKGHSNPAKIKNYNDHEALSAKTKGNTITSDLQKNLHDVENVNEIETKDDHDVQDNFQLKSNGKTDFEVPKDEVVTNLKQKSKNIDNKRKSKHTEMYKQSIKSRGATKDLGRNKTDKGEKTKGKDPSHSERSNREILKGNVEGISENIPRMDNNDDIHTKAHAKQEEVKSSKVLTKINEILTQNEDKDWNQKQTSAIHLQEKGHIESSAEATRKGNPNTIQKDNKCKYECKANANVKDKSAIEDSKKNKLEVKQLSTKRDQKVTLINYSTSEAIAAKTQNEPANTDPLQINEEYIEKLKSQQKHHFNRVPKPEAEEDKVHVETKSQLYNSSGTEKSLQPDHHHKISKMNSSNNIQKKSNNKNKTLVGTVKNHRKRKASSSLEVNKNETIIGVKMIPFSDHMDESSVSSHEDVEKLKKSKILGEKVSPDEFSVSSHDVAKKLKNSTIVGVKVSKAEFSENAKKLKISKISGEKVSKNESSSSSHEDAKKLKKSKIVGVKLIKTNDVNNESTIQSATPICKKLESHIEDAATNKEKLHMKNITSTTFFQNRAFRKDDTLVSATETDKVERDVTSASISSKTSCTSAASVHARKRQKSTI